MLALSLLLERERRSKHDFIVLVVPLGFGLSIALNVTFVPSIEVPEEDLFVSATGDKTAVIFEPLDVLDALLVLVKAEDGWLLHRVELVDIDTESIIEGKEVTAVGEFDLLDISHVRNRVVRFKPVIQQIHHLDAVLESDDNVEAGGVDGETHGGFFELAAHFELEVVPGVPVGPDAHCPVRAAGRYQLFLYADI